MRVPRHKIVIPGSSESRHTGEASPPAPSRKPKNRRQFVVPDPGSQGGSGSGAAPSGPKAKGKVFVASTGGDGGAPVRRGGRNSRPDEPGANDQKSAAPKKKKKVLRRTLQVVAGIVALLALYYGIVAIRTNAAIRHTKPDVLSALSHDPGPTNVLIVGSDTREGANSLIPGESKAGLADVIMVVQLRGTSARILSIPRDTRVRLAGYGDQKINASLPLGGAPMAVNAVKSVTGLPIHRFAEIDFEGFLRITDAVGGVKLCLEAAERDEFSGLNLKAGCQTVAGEQALAFVRSRHTEVFENGRWVADGTGDLGRIQRQQMFMGALMRELKNPITLTIDAWDLGPAIGSAFITDPDFGPFDGLRSATALVGGSDSMELVALPTVPATSRGIAFLDVKQPEAGQVLAHFKET